MSSKQVCTPNLVHYKLHSILSTLNSRVGVHFLNPFVAGISHLAGFSYVDDCDMIQSDDYIETIHSKMQLAIMEWEDLIRITGGFLIKYKSVWCLVDYEWRRGKWKCTNPRQGKNIEDTNKAGEIVPLRYLWANESMSMLGIYLAADGNNKDQVKYIQKRQPPGKIQ